jgi:hypothetical protein
VTRRAAAQATGAVPVVPVELAAQRLGGAITLDMAYLPPALQRSNLRRRPIDERAAA